MQRDEWTFEGAGEVTVNIFSMHATQFVVGQSVLEQKWVQGVGQSFDKYFENTPTYNTWQENVGMALMTFVQLIKHFGWEPMHKFMKNYEVDIASRASSLPKNNQDKIDQWVLRYSRIIGFNIRPQFMMFGLPVSNFVNDELKDLEPWCPLERSQLMFFATF